MVDLSIMPLFAVLCYSFLLITFLAAKKNKIINSFIRVLIYSTIWTGGSLLMRSQAFSMDKFWYDLSIFGLVFLVFELLIFIKKMLDVKTNGFDIFLFVLSAVLVVINTFTGFFLKAPVVTINEFNNKVFIYNITWTVSFMVILLTTIFIYLILLLFRDYKESCKRSLPTKTIAFGLLILFLGHVITILPLFEGFPVDILSGILFVFILFYALYSKKLFQLNLLLSKNILYIISLGFSMILLINRFDFIINITEPLTENLDNQIMLIAVAFTVFIFIIFRVMELFINKIYISKEAIRNKVIREFKDKALSSLVIEEISKLFINVIKKNIGTREVLVLLPDKNHKFSLIQTSNPLNKISLSYDKNQPLIRIFSEKKRILSMDELKQLSQYKSLWKDEKTRLDMLNIKYFVPLVHNNELISLIMLTEKTNNKYNNNDLLLLEGISIITAIALKNANLYNIVYNEARQDDLTKLLNRKYFLSELQTSFEKESVLTVSIINIDNFKLYNQLYGMKEGDNLLKSIAEIIRATMENIGYASRYDSKVFACAFPNYDISQAKVITEKIKNQICKLNSKNNDYEMRKVTVSCGISSIPYLARTPEDLLKDADLAVYYVKKNGKNNIRVSSGQIIHSNKKLGRKKEKSEIYSRYAQTIHALTATIHTKDNYTFDHSNNVAYYATELANGLSLDKDSIEIVKEAALLHDIGKIGIDENILNKKGRLNNEEFEIMKGHVENSINIIKHLPSLDYLIPAVIGHHERWDGKGYPRNLKGLDIPLFARILCIADSFDAILSNRPYKDAHSLEYALEELKNLAGKQFDPEMIEIFLELVVKEHIVPIFKNETTIKDASK